MRWRGSGEVFFFFLREPPPQFTNEQIFHSLRTLSLLRRFSLVVSSINLNAVRRPPHRLALRGPLFGPSLEHWPRLRRRFSCSPRCRLPPRGRLVPRALRGEFFWRSRKRKRTNERKKKKQAGAAIDPNRIRRPCERGEATLDKRLVRSEKRRSNAPSDAERGTRDVQLEPDSKARKRRRKGIIFSFSSFRRAAFFAVAKQDLARKTLSNPPFHQHSSFPTNSKTAPARRLRGARLQGRGRLRPGVPDHQPVPVQGKRSKFGKKSKKKSTFFFLLSHRLTPSTSPPRHFFSFLTKKLNRASTSCSSSTRSTSPLCAPPVRNERERKLGGERERERKRKRAREETESKIHT